MDNKDQNINLNVTLGTQSGQSQVLAAIAALSTQMNTMLSLLQQIFTVEGNIMKELDDLAVQVKANTDVEQSAIVLIQGIAAQLAANAGNPAVITGLSQQLKASADALGAAVVANTPAQPPA